MDQVKFIHDALGESTIKNMATEATLKELLEAIGGGSGSSRRTGRGGGSLSQLPGMFKSFKEKAQSLNQGIKSASAPFTGFVSVLAKSDVAMGNFAEGLNNQVIAKLPIFGGLISGFGAVAVSGIKVLDEWNRQTMRNVPAGATFGNSLVNLVQYASDSRMTLDAFQTMVGENIQRFNTLGPTTDQGIRLFSQFSNALFSANNGLIAEFRNMGYTFRDVNESALDFLYYTQRGINNTLNVNQATQKEFAGYLRQFDLMTKLMGMSNREQQDRARALLNNSMFMINMNERGDVEAGRIVRAGQMLTGFYGSEIAQSFMAIAFGQNTAYGSAAQIRLLLPGIQDTLVNLYNLATRPETTEQEFTDAMDQLLAESLHNSQGQIQNIQGLINMMSAGGLEGAGYESLQGIIETVVDKGIQGKTPAQILEMIREARAQQRNTETIAQILRSFQDLATEFSTGLLRGLVPNLNTLGNVLQQYNIPQLMEEMGTQFGHFVRRAWDDIQAFFGYLETDQGRQYLLNQGVIFMTQFGEIAKIRFQRALSRLMELAFGENLTSFLTSLNDRLSDMFGLGVPMYVTEQEAREDIARARFNAGAALGRNTRLLEMTPTPTQQPYEGQVVYPNWNRYMGEDEDYGPLVFRNGQWQTPLGLSRAVEEDLIANLNMLAGTELTSNPNLALLFYPGGERELVNKRYVAHFQQIVDYLSNLGVPIQRVIGYRPGSERHGVGATIQLLLENNQRLYDILTQREIFDLMEIMGELGLGPELPRDLRYSDLQTNERYVDTFMDLANNNRISALGFAHANPNEFRTGTLEETGRLFNDFGRRRRVTLTGDKAVLTREQYEVIKDASAQIPIRDMLAGLNTSVQEMINLTRQEIRSDRAKLSAL